MSHRFKKITVIHLCLLLTHNAKLDKFINWKEVRNSVEPREALKSFRSSDLCLLIGSWALIGTSDRKKMVKLGKFFASSA